MRLLCIEDSPDKQVITGNEYNSAKRSICAKCGTIKEIITNPNKTFSKLSICICGKVISQSNLGVYINSKRFIEIEDLDEVIKEELTKIKKLTA